MSNFLKRRTPLRKISKKRVREMVEYRKKREIYLREHPICEVCGTSAATEIHHVRGRHSGGFLDEKTFLAVCRYCHNKIHAYPKWAEELGYLSKKR